MRRCISEGCTRDLSHTSETLCASHREVICECDVPTVKVGAVVGFDDVECGTCHRAVLSWLEVRHKAS